MTEKGEEAGEERKEKNDRRLSQREERAELVGHGADIDYNCE